MYKFVPHPQIALGKSKFDSKIHKAYYKHDYVALEQKIEGFDTQKKRNEQRIATYRHLILNDLWYIVNFVMKIPGANHPFVVNASNMVEDGPEGWCLDLWARYHFKSTIKTKARTIQRILKYPDKCTMIASYARKASKKFVNPIALELETNDMLKIPFPDVLYRDPRKQAPKWSEDEGYTVIRSNKSRSEQTLEAHGVKEGMPTGSHFDFIELDDFEVKDIVRNPDVIQLCRDALDLCNFLLVGSVEGFDGQDAIEGGVINVTGTPYSHIAVYFPHVLNKLRANGEKKFTPRIKPATHDGTKTGVPVMMTKEALADVYADLASDGYGEYNFNAQMLIDPTPKGTQKLNSAQLMNIDARKIPSGLVKFLLIDPAGDDEENKKRGDDWAVWIIGVEPKLNDHGIRDRYILDGYLDVISESAAPELIGRMFMNNGPIRKTGYEYKGVSPAWLQNMCDFVRVNGGVLFEDPKMGMIMRCKDGGKQKQFRITSAWSKPLNYGCCYISNEVPLRYNQKLREEMDKFGFWPDNGLDSAAYLEDVMRDVDFNAMKKSDPEARKRDRERAQRECDPLGDRR
jgi:hypothetical protein